MKYSKYQQGNSIQNGSLFGTTNNMTPYGNIFDNTDYAAQTASQYGKNPSYLSGTTKSKLTTGQTKSKLTTGQTMGVIGSSLDTVGSALIPKTENSSGVDAAFQVGDAASNALMQINPMAGGIAKAGLFALKTINSIGGSKADSFNLNKDAFSTVGSDYTGSSSLASDAMSKSGKRYGLFSGGASSANRAIAKANLQQDKVANIASQTMDDKNKQNSMSSIYNNKYATDLLGGYKQKDIRIGKVGLKLPTKKQIAKIDKFLNGGSTQSYLVATKPVYEVVEEFKSGGQIKGNIIPEGALHARKNNMDVQSITNKGIPVVSEDKDGIVQQAEIECNEIIFNKDVTNKLEEFFRNSSDKTAIECGKLLATEIVENTEDRTGLIKGMLSQK